MRKPAFCICENKDADQLYTNRVADQRLCFRYMDSAIPLLSKSEFQVSSHLLWLYTAWFVSDLVENPEDPFSHNEARMVNVIIELLSNKFDNLGFGQTKSQISLVIFSLISLNFQHEESLGL